MHNNPAKDEDAEAYTKELAQAHTTNQLRNQDQTQEMWLQSPSLIAEHMPTSTRLHLLVPNAPLPLAHQREGGGGQRDVQGTGWPFGLEPPCRTLTAQPEASG